MTEERRKLNIAMICDPIGINKAGVAVSALRFGKLLTERGHHVIFVGARSKEYKDHNYHDGKKIFKKENIDIAHMFLPMSGAIVAIKAAQSLNIKTVAHSHSQPENLFMSMPGLIRPALGHIWNKYLAWFYSKADSLIYPSEMARSLLNKLGRVNQPSSIISNGVNIEKFRILPVGNFHERFNIPNNKIKLLFVGRLFPEKSINTLIKAIPHIIKEYKNIHLMIVGAGYLRPQLEKLMYSLKVDQYVTFLGLISEEDIILAYNASDIFVLPSIAELEGMDGKTNISLAL